jgi:4-alpha-glucanotransferase
LRGCGILLPISCLPSPYGIGSLGLAAFRFIDFLHSAGQRYWQILPIGPTGYGDSPYQSFSAFAANPYFIDLDLLIAEGLLQPDEVGAGSWGDLPGRVDYGLLFENRFKVLRLATCRMDPADGAFRAFTAAESVWLDDYALFMAVKTTLGLIPLLEWPLPYRLRDPAVLDRFRREKQVDILFWQQVQFLFYRQWQALKTYAHQKGIEIIGDLPIYVSPDSSDLWAEPDLFQADSQLKLIDVAGCPPDPYAPDGQLWGNPLYNWPRHQETGFAWWIERLKQAGRVYDIVRIDHFRGFESYYAIPGSHTAAAHGVWRQGPGLGFITMLRQNLPDLRIIAEDLGFITSEVRQLLLASGYPGMKVLQFAFESLAPGEYKPFTYLRNTVAYTGTHDNTTTEDWFYSSPAESVQIACDYLDVSCPADFTWRFIRAVLSSVADTCVIPMQDYLRLGAEARVNTPSTKTGNWQWRIDPACLTAELAAKIRNLARLYGRLQE